MGKNKPEKTLSLSFSYDNFEIDNFKVIGLEYYSSAAFEERCSATPL